MSRRWSPTSSTLFLMVTVVILGIGMRVPILSVAPLLETIATDLSMSAAQAGWLSTIPVLCFGTVALAAPALTRRWGMDTILMAMFLILLIGLLVRGLQPVWLLFGGTVLVGSGIAVSNVVLPGFIKREASNNLGPTTALYSAAISGGGAIGAGFTVPIMETFDLTWRDALRWPVFVVVAGLVILIPWQVSARSGAHMRGRKHVPTGLWTNRVAWYVTGYMGAQSFLFFSVTGWLPTHLITEGASKVHAGYMLGLSPLFGVAGSFIAPLLVHKRQDQVWLVWVASIMCAIGIGGLILAPLTLTPLWVAHFGFGSGMTLSIALTFIGLRTPDPDHAADLSMMSQAVGYSIAAIGPIGIGLVHDAFDSWRVAFIVILSIIPVLTWVGIGGGKSRLVTD